MKILSENMNKPKAVEGILSEKGSLPINQYGVSFDQKASFQTQGAFGRAPEGPRYNYSPV